MCIRDRDQSILDHSIFYMERSKETSGFRQGIKAMRPLCGKKHGGNRKERLRPYASFPDLRRRFNVPLTPAPRRDRPSQCSRLSCSLRRRCRPCDILRRAPEKPPFQSRRPPAQGRGCGAAAARRRESCPADWRYCGPRYPARCRCV